VIVFADTSALYALLDRTDANHSSSQRVFETLVRTERVVTHNYVAVECAALVQRRLGAEAVRALFDDLLAALELVWVDESLHRRAAAAMIAAGSSDVSLVDRTSFEVMRDRGIDHAFAFDDDFAKQGFALLT
jgi:predicted nucleic acid-binding protein